ncbi:MAG TPA: hypothetical protein VKR06_05210 [Ktedonosporobacter sp.]|nr:hypothetical protein [Ktedonosporobacter sp.]
MEHAELDRVSAALAHARAPEEVFGNLTGTRSEMLEAARSIFRQMAKTVHPDLYQGTPDFDKAGSTFKKLAHFWELAQTRIAHDCYGADRLTPSYGSDRVKPFEPFTIRTRRRLYSIERVLAHGDLCALYVATSTPADGPRRTPPVGDPCENRMILKIPLKPEDNDLVANEARVLRHLRSADDYDRLRHFVSDVVDTFSYHEAASGMVRQVNALSYVEGLYSLKEVREAYPRGVDPKDMAWIWRRLLVALAFAHGSKVIHGAVLPTHTLIHPDQHGVVLIDWSYATIDPEATGERISALSSAYRGWYPEEVFAKKAPTPGLDLTMGAICMIELLGGDPEQRTMPETAPWQLQNYLKGCTLPTSRPHDAHSLLIEFDALIERLWGPKTFHAFSMPTHFEKEGG